jgi:hypothetical protein
VATLPNSELLRDKLTNAPAMVMGAKVGLMASLALAPLIVALNVFFRKNPLSLQVFKNELVNPLRDSLAKDKLTGKNIAELGKQLAITTSESLLLGGTIGVGIAAADMTQTRDKLVKASRLKDGLPPNRPWYEFYKKDTKQTPEQVLNDVKTKDLDKKHAFKRGFVETFLVKEVGGTLLTALQVAIGAGGAMLLMGGFKKKSLSKESLLAYAELAKLFVMESFLKQPTLVVKAIAAPFIGGLVGMKLVPLINERLGRTPQGQAPAPTATPLPLPLAQQALQPQTA